MSRFHGTVSGTTGIPGAQLNTINIVTSNGSHITITGTHIELEVQNREPREPRPSTGTPRRSSHQPALIPAAENSDTETEVVFNGSRAEPGSPKRRGFDVPQPQVCPSVLVDVLAGALRSTQDTPQAEAAVSPVDKGIPKLRGDKNPSHSRVDDVRSGGAQSSRGSSEGKTRDDSNSGSSRRDDGETVCHFHLNLISIALLTVTFTNISLKYRDHDR